MIQEKKCECNQQIPFFDKYWPLNAMVKNSCIFVKYKKQVWEKVYITQARSCGGGGGQMLMFADMVGEWGCSIADVS